MKPFFLLSVSLNCFLLFEWKWIFLDMTVSLFHLKAIIPILCMQQPFHTNFSSPEKLTKDLVL